MVILILSHQLTPYSQRYPCLDDCKDALSQIVTDYVFLCSARYSLRNTVKASVPSYMYQFRRVPPACPWPKGQHYCCDACCHGDEIPYVFHDVSGPIFPWHFNATDVALADQISGFWASLAHTGIPSFQNVKWPQWDPKSLYSASFDIPEAKFIQNIQGNTCDFWDSIGYLTERHGP